MGEESHFYLSKYIKSLESKNENRLKSIWYCTKNQQRSSMLPLSEPNNSRRFSGSKANEESVPFILSAWRRVHWQSIYRSNNNSQHDMTERTLYLCAAFHIRIDTQFIGLSGNYEFTAACCQDEWRRVEMR